MELEQLRTYLAEISAPPCFDIEKDPEKDHQKADALLLEYINDLSVYYYFDKIKKYYA